MKKNPIFTEKCQQLLQEEEKNGKISIIPLNSSHAQEILKGVHYFSYINIVFNEDSLSSPVRVVVDGSRPVPFLKMATADLPANCIDSMNSLLNAILVFRMSPYAFSLDIRKAWLGIILKGLFNKLNLLAWYQNLREIKEEVLILRHSGAFGYNFMNCIFELINAKFISPEIKSEAVKVAVQLGRICDNLSSSEATEEEEKKRP